MIVYRIYCGNFEGSSYYRTREDAQNAANLRTNYTGIEWTVREIYLP